MIVNDLRLGDSIILGRENASAYAQMEVDLEWMKVSLDNDFILVNHARYTYFDTPEPDSPSRDRRRHGNSFYPHSNIRQWLNSSKEDWYTSAHAFDRPPAIMTGALKSGFLSGFTQAELDILCPRTICGNVPRGSIKEFGKQYSVSDLVSLPSLCELAPIQQHSMLPQELLDGSTPFTMFERTPRSAFDNPLQRSNIATRSSFLAHSYIVHTAYGAHYNVYADQSSPVFPVIRIKAESPVEGTRSPFISGATLSEQSALTDYLFEILQT